MDFCGDTRHKSQDRQAKAFGHAAKFTMMNRWDGSELQFANKLNALQIAFDPSHRSFSSGAVPLSSKPGGWAGRVILATH
jgi:hypothetical protein